MKKAKLFILSIALMFIGIIGVNAEEITVCSSGCDHNNMLAAINAATDGDTIKMTENMTNSDLLLVTKSVTFDLGGKKLTTSQHFVVLPRTGTNPDVIIKNGTIELTDKDIQLVVQGADVKDTANTKLTIEKDATILNNSEGNGVAAIMVQSAGNEAYDTIVDIKGTVKGTTFAITIHGDTNKVDAQAPIINIYDSAKLTSVSGPAIYGAGYGFWNINGGTIEGKEALSIKSGEYTITGGKFSATGEYVENPISDNSGSEPTGAAISITANNSYAGHVKMNISGGEFTSKNGNAIYEGQTNSNSTVVDEIKISDGKFISAEGKATVRVTSTSDKLEGFIAGGEYSEDPKEELIVQNKVTKQLPNGNYVIGEERNIKVADTKNGKVTVDKSKAVKGEIIKLTITPDKGYELDKIIVKGLQDQKEITGTEFEMIDEDIEFVVTFKKVSTSVKNPNTGDNIMMILSIAFISLAGIIAASKKLKSNC